MEDRQLSVQERKVKTFIEVAGILITFAGLLVATYGVFLADRALIVYKNQASISVLNRLDEADARIHQLELERPHLASFFVELDSSLSPKARSDTLLQLMAGCGHKPNKPCSEERGQLPNWKTIPQLDCALFSPELAGKETTRRLLEGFNFAESILYIVARAHQRKDYIGEAEYKTWASYISNNAHHPLMLTAIHFGYEHGYITPEFSTELKELLKKSKKASVTIAAIYPEFFQIDNPGKMQGVSSCGG